MSNCKICNTPVQSLGTRPKMFCSDACKQKAHRARKNHSVTIAPKHCPSPIVTDGYSAASVRVISDSERIFNPAFDWELAARLASEYAKPEAWLSRSIEACRHAGVSPEYFIRRYLQKLPERMNPEVDNEFRRLHFYANREVI